MDYGSFKSSNKIKEENQNCVEMKIFNSCNYNLNLNLNLSIVEIAVVGNQNVGKTTLIKYWLSWNIKSISTSDMYSKLIWHKNRPIQINIYKLSSENFRENFSTFLINGKIFHSIIYVYNIENEFSKNMVPVWIKKMDYYANDFTYKIVIGLSKNSNNTLDDKILEIKNFYSGYNIEYFCVPAHFVDNSKILKEIFLSIITRVYQISVDDTTNSGTVNVAKQEFNKDSICCNCSCIIS
ncbi:MAG: putative orfan [Satyrvirus sp.]|uniref:Putative orfan n=1 Tax=Satyrvirus sp. TaxID=2487771 RepID=A0A3G5AI86_9VIRU|nr:MAG: putative orfan [Satyrvirus sp.]